MNSAAEDGAPVIVAGAESKGQQLCKVCGDRASGKHYGVISCDGCRGFFKRAIRKKMGRLYRCKDNNSCIVDVSRRNQCQACRYRRCMEVKMNPNAVQKERSPRPPRDDNHGPTAIVTPEINSVYPHLLQNCPPNFFCPYPGAPYPYPPQVYYASTSLYPRLAAMQYHQHPGLSLALANALPIHGHVVSQASLAKMEKAMHASGKDTPEKLGKTPAENEVKVEDYSMEARPEDQESEKENQRASTKSPDSGNSSASPDHMTSALERSFLKGHVTFSPISSSALSLSQSPEVGVKAAMTGVGSPLKKTLTPATRSQSAFVMPINHSPATSLTLAFSSSASSPAKAKSSSSSLLFKSMTSAGTPPLAVVSSPAAIFSFHGGSAPGVASPGDPQFSGGHSAFSPGHKSCLPLPLPVPGFLQLAAPSPSNMIPAASSIHAQPHVSLPSETAAAAFLDNITTSAAAAAVAPLPASARSFPVPVSLTQATHAAMSWAPHLPAPSSPWPSTLPHFSDKDETQLVTHALQAVQANIRWVAGLPSFAELSRRDQLVLLEQSWCELLVLTSLQSQLCHEMVFLTSLSSLQNKEALSVELMNISARAHALSIDTEELSLLRCLALFRPERRGLVDSRTVEAIQENATVMLNQHVQTMGPPVHAPGLRHTKLLLLLRDIQHLDAAALAACVFRRVPHALPLELFVCNLFTMALDRR